MDTNLNVSSHPYILFFVSIVALQTILLCPPLPSLSLYGILPRILKYFVAKCKKEIILFENVCGIEYRNHPPSAASACLPALEMAVVTFRLIQSEIQMRIASEYPVYSCDKCVR